MFWAVLVIAAVELLLIAICLRSCTQ